MARRGRTSSKSKDLWKPTKLDKKAVFKRVEQARFYLRRIELDTERNSVLLDVDYDDLMQQVEALYGLLDIGSLAQDNKRRMEESKPDDE